MASVTKKNNKNGSIIHKVRINKNGVHICKSFSDPEDAELFIYYKEKLIENMKNFDVSLSQRLTLGQIFELKIEGSEELDTKSINDMRLSLSRLEAIFGENRCYFSITIEEWTESVKSIMGLKVYRGAKNKNGERDISFKSIKKIFAHASSCVTFCQNMGFKIDNKPMSVIQNTITPIIKGKEK